MKNFKDTRLDSGRSIGAAISFLLFIFLLSCSGNSAQEAEKLSYQLCERATECSRVELEQYPEEMREFAEGMITEVGNMCSEMVAESFKDEEARSAITSEQVSKLRSCVRDMRRTSCEELSNEWPESCSGSLEF